MTKRIWTSLIFGAGLLSGCAGGVTRNNEVDLLRNQVSELQKTQALQAAEIRDLRDQLSITEKKPVEAKPAANPILPEVTSEDIAIVQNLTPKDIEGLEAEYYKAQTLARKGAPKEVEAIVGKMRRSAPHSPWTQDALFMLGEVYFRASDFLKAAETFETLYSNYPDGNKSVSALFSVGLCYRKLEKIQDAKEAFQSVMAIYPGSREALKSKVQLDALEKSS